MTSARSSTPSIPPLSPQRFGDYYLTGHLGRGGMADVYLARYMGAAGFQRTVVIKRVLNVADPESIRMFINEAKVAAELTHPNIVQLYELGERAGEFFIAMEYVRGAELGKLMNALAARRQVIPRGVAALIAREVCRGLAYAHAHTDSFGTPRPIIHRDVSPGNVVISYDGQVKLVDFGIAKALEADVPQTQAGLIKGKLGYMAPEQLDGHTTPQCDVFSTGVVLFEMLTLRRLIAADNVLEQVTKLKTMAFPTPSSTSPEVGPELDAIVGKALERNLALRYATALVMARDLDAIVAAERVSVEDLARFMGEVFPPESRVDPAHAGVPNAYAERSVTPPTLSFATGLDQPAAGVPAGASQNPAGSPPPAPRRSGRGGRGGLLVLGAALIAVAAGAVGYALSRAQPRREVVASTTPEPHAAAPTVAPLPAEAPAAQPAAPPSPPSAVRGVTDHEIVLGMATAMSGSAKEYGRQMKLGLESAFRRANEQGGVAGRQLRLVTVDDGYDPLRTGPAMKELYERDNVFGVLGNFGTATASVAVPFALDHKMLFYGAATGATLLRRDPPDRYVFNFRASYAEEAAAIASYLIRVRRMRPERIAVLVQDDPFGDSVYASLSKTMRALRPDAAPLFRVNYQRNTVDVKDAVAQLRARGVSLDAVVLLAITRPAVRFMEQLTAWSHGVQFITGSWTDSASLAEELKLIGLRSTNGVVITQVVPSSESSATAVLEFKAAMGKYSPEERIDSVALEGYLMANVLLEALRRAGRELDTERVVAALEAIHDFNLGIGTLIGFGPTEHQGSHKVWGLQLDANGRYVQVDLE